MRKTQSSDVGPPLMGHTAVIRSVPWPQACLIGFWARLRDLRRSHPEGTAMPHRPSKPILAAVAVAAVFALAPVASSAHAAGTAFAVDTSEISEVGSCKIEAWYSAARNQDRVATANPACVVDLFVPFELSAQITQSRADGEWATGIAPKAKTKLVPTAIGSFGLAIAGGTSFDLETGENTTIFAYAPATLRLSERWRINVNGGWLWDRSADKHFATYGLSSDLKLTETVTWTIEGFGQLGERDPDDHGVTQPRFQTGLRYRPVDRFSVDLIYGQNINGEQSHWLTLATTIRFPADGK
jgi:hypothetical protein